MYQLSWAWLGREQRAIARTLSKSAVIAGPRGAPFVSQEKGVKARSSFNILELIFLAGGAVAGVSAIVKGRQTSS